MPNQEKTRKYVLSGIGIFKFTRETIKTGHDVEKSKFKFASKKRA